MVLRNYGQAQKLDFYKAVNLYR